MGWKKLEFLYFVTSMYIIDQIEQVRCLLIVGLTSET